MIKRIIISLFLICSPLIRAADCIPLTFEFIGEYLGKPISYNQWYKELMPDNQPPDLPTCINVFDAHFPDHKLLCVWAAPDFAQNTIVYKKEFIQKRIYLWIGIEPVSMIAPGETANSHSAICIFDKQKIFIVTILHKEPGNTDNIYVQELSEEMFAKETYFLFEIIGSRI